MLKFTKIGATIGPACDTSAKIEAMIKAGMNFARLNFAHGTHPEYVKMIKRLREAEQKTGEPIAILQDLQGPRLRVGTLPSAGVIIKAGETIVFNTAAGAPSGPAIPLDHPELHKYIVPGARLLIDDGRIAATATKVAGTSIFATVSEGGTVLSHKGLNLPDSNLAIPVMSDKDLADLRFGIQNGVDMVGLSFVSSAKDILDLRYLIAQISQEEKIKLARPIFIIAKIERHEAVKNLAEIIAAADGIMVARGDLGLELPKAEVPLIQKKIIDACNAAAKPVIVATQLLDSMRENLRPTRAEVSDVANAVIDHADALLLTNETAAGKYPVETVATMTEIIRATEKSRYDDLAPALPKKHASTERAITDLSKILAGEVGAKLILAASLTGETGRLISHVRPTLPILVATNDAIVWRQLNLSWGVKPFILPPCQTIEELVDRSVSHIKQHKLGKNADKMIIVAGEPVGQAGNVNLVEVREIK